MRSGKYYDYVIGMIERSTYEDRALLDRFFKEDPYHNKSLFAMIRQVSRVYERKNIPVEAETAYKILIEAVSDYIFAYSTSYAAKQRIYKNMYAWCVHMGKQYAIANYEDEVQDLPEQLTTDYTIGFVKELHNQDGVTKQDLATYYGGSTKKVQVFLHRLTDHHSADPVRIGGQPVYLKIEHTESNRKLGERKYYTRNTMSPVVFQMNIMQVETLMKSFQLNYDTGNNIPLDMAIDTWSQLSDYARQRIRDVFCQRDQELSDFLDLVEDAMNSDEYRFMTEAEMLSDRDVSVSEQLLIADKGDVVCNISLTGPHRTRKRQKIKYDHSTGKYRAISVDDPASEPIYFKEEEVYRIEEA